MLLLLLDGVLPFLHYLFRGFSHLFRRMRTKLANRETSPAFLPRMSATRRQKRVVEYGWRLQRGRSGRNIVKVRRMDATETHYAPLSTLLDGLRKTRVVPQALRAPSRLAGALALRIDDNCI